MNIDKINELKVGMVFKNYKELCRFCEDDVKTGNAKIYQLENYKRYFDWEKQGNKFVITAIHEIPTDKKLSGKDAIYGLELDALFKNSLIESKIYTNKHLYTKLLPIVDGKNNVEFFEDNAIDLTLIYNCKDDSLIQQYRSKMLRTLTVDISRSLNRLSKNDIITYKDIIVADCLPIDKSIITAKHEDFKKVVLMDSDYNKVTKIEKEAREELNVTGFQVNVNKATRKKFDEVVRFKMESLDTLKGYRILKYWKAMEIDRLDYRLIRQLNNDKVTELLNVYTKDLTYRIYESCVRKLYDGTLPFTTDDKLLDLQTKIAFLNDCLFINETTELDINFFDRNKIIVAI